MKEFYIVVEKNDLEDVLKNLEEFQFKEVDPKFRIKAGGPYKTKIEYLGDKSYEDALKILKEKEIQLYNPSDVKAMNKYGS